MRIVGPDVPGVPTILPLRPETVSDGLKRVANLVHDLAMPCKVRKLGVVEFASLTGKREVLGKLGPFGRTAAEKVERHLIDMAGNHYSVADQRQLLSALAAFGAGDIADADSLARLPKRVPRLEAVLTGTFQRKRNPDRLELGCKLLRLPGGEVLASIASIIRIDEDLWAMLGGSADVINPENETRLEPVDVLEHEANKPHPLLRPNFPFRVEIVSGGKPKQLWSRGPNELLFGAREGEEFEIHVENHHPQRVLMRLLVDGVNTIIQKNDDTDVQHVLLEEARGWVLDPGSQYAIIGWHLGVGAKAPVKRFKFVAPPKSVAERLGFGESIGLIIAVFYAEAGRGRGTPQIAVGMGTDEERDVVEAKPFRIGRQLGVVSLRYVSEAALQTQ